MQDIATAIGNSLSRDGAGGMRGNRITGLGPGIDPTDAATVGQLNGGGGGGGGVVLPITADDFNFTSPGSGGIAQSGTRKLARRVDVMDFVPKALWSGIENGTDTTDHWSYVMSAKAFAGKRKVILNAGSWNTSKEVDFNGTGRIEGEGVFVSSLVATAKMRSVLRLNGQTITASDLSIVAGNAQQDFAQYGVFPDGTNGSVIERLSIDYPSVEGIAFLEGNSNNTDTVVQSNLIRHCGRKVFFGTTTLAAAGAYQAITVNLSGYSSSTPALLGAGLVRPYDWLKIGSLPAFEIQSFDPSSGQAVVFIDQDIPPQNNVNVSVYQGNGVAIQRNGNSSKLKLYFNEIQFCAMGAIDCCSLYGVDSVGNTAEITGIPIIIGRRVGGGESQPINWSDRDLYAENYSEGGVYYLGSNREGNIDNPMADTASNYGMDMVRIADPIQTLRTLNAKIEGVLYARRFEPTNISVANLRPGDTVEFTQSSGAGDITANLFVPAVNGNARHFMPWMTAPIIIDTGDIGGKTLTIKSADGTTPINGGAASVQVKGNYRTITCRWSNYGWRVYGASPPPIPPVRHNQIGGQKVGAGLNFAVTDFSSAEFQGVDFTKCAISADAIGESSDPAAAGSVYARISYRSATRVTVTVYNNAPNSASDTTQYLDAILTVVPLP